MSPSFMRLVELLHCLSDLLSPEPMLFKFEIDWQSKHPLNVNHFMCDVYVTITST